MPQQESLKILPSFGTFISTPCFWRLSCDNTKLVFTRKLMPCSPVISILTTQMEGKVNIRPLIADYSAGSAAEDFEKYISNTHRGIVYNYPVFFMPWHKVFISDCGWENDDSEDLLAVAVICDSPSSPPVLISKWGWPISVHISLTSPLQMREFNLMS